MEINMIRCDICGKTVDYNDKKIVDMVSNQLLSRDYLYTDGGFYERLKINRLTMRGITNGKNIQEFIDKGNNYENIIVNMEFDLCEDCLIELYKMINKYIKEARE